MKICPSPFIWVILILHDETGCKIMFYILGALKWDFCQFYEQNELRIVRQWRHQLSNLHILIDVSQNVLWKSAKLQNAITSMAILCPIFIKFAL